MSVRDGLFRSGVPPRLATAIFRPGIYAWWGSEIVPWPTDFPNVDETLPLYIGIADSETLAQRFSAHHLQRTRGSALRRSLAGLLANQLGLASFLVAGSPRRPDKFGLTPVGEATLTDWMERHLLVTWVELDSPGEDEKRLIRELTPPLNDRDASGSVYRAPMRVIRSEFGRG